MSRTAASRSCTARRGSRASARASTRAGRLLPLPIARVRNTLSDYRRTAESLGAERTLLVATSAVRDAENGEAFLGEIEWSYGFATRLLSGDEEAGLTQRGVGELGTTTLLVDIGGGSTELALDGFRTSLPMGSGRFTERHGEDVEASIQAARALLPELDPQGAVGVAATITSIAALDLGLEEYDRARVHGHVLTRDGARAQLERLAALPLEERRRVPALDPDRAPVIVAGGAILACDPRRVRARVDPRQRTRPARRRRARRGRAPRTGGGRCASRRLHLLLEDERPGIGLRFRRLVLSEAALHDGA